MNCNSVGISDLDLDDVVKIYPNPATTHIQIETNFPIESIEIYNYCGSVVKFSSDLIHENKLSLANLPSGIYTIKISISSKIFIKKFQITY